MPDRAFAASVLLALAAAAPARAALPAGRVDGVRIDASTSAFAYADGTVLRDGSPLPDGAPESERARRVALFALTLERDPFFFTPEDASVLPAAVARLAAADADLLSRVGASEELHPLKFWRAYAAASAAYRAFAAAPSESGAAGLLAAIREGVEAYAAEASAIGASVDARFTSMKADKLAGIEGLNYTDRPTVAADFGMIRKNAQAARVQLDALAACLGDSAKCRPVRRPVAVDPAAGALPAPLSASEYPIKDRNESGPYVVRSRCWGGEDALLDYAEYCPAGRPCMEWEHLATGPLFNPPEASTRPVNAPGRMMSLDPINLATLYGCPDKAYMADLIALDSFERRFGDRSAFEGAAASGLSPGAAAAVAAAERAEKAFRSEKTRSRRALQELANAYGDALDALEASSPLGRDLTERRRVASLNAERLELLLDRVTFHLANFDDKNVKRLGGDSRRWLAPAFLTRNHYAILFMPFSPTVWRIAERPVYVAGSLPPAERRVRLLTFQEATARYGRDEVLRSMRAFTEHRRREHIKGLARPPAPPPAAPPAPPPIPPASTGGKK